MINDTQLKCFGYFKDGGRAQPTRTVYTLTGITGPTGATEQLS